jgi:hypothetical protein
MERSGRNQCAPPPADDLATEAERGDVAHARTLELERARRRLHAHSLVAVSVRERLAATLVALTAEELAQLLLERLLQDQPGAGRPIASIGSCSSRTECEFVGSLRASNPAAVSGSKRAANV